MHIKKLLFAHKYKFAGHPYNSAQPIAFMHIPKTSGMALAHGLRNALAPNRAVEGFDLVLFGAFREFSTLAPSERRRIYVDTSDLPVDGDFVAGHFAFSTLLNHYGSANYLTVFREPMSRVLSSWLYGCSIPEGHLALLGAWARYVRQAQRPLRDFLSCNEVACVVDNVCIRMLLWPHRLIPEDDFIEPRHDQILLNEATARLRLFSFADVIENPNMLADLQTWLGRSVPYAPINETVHILKELKRPLHGELTPYTIHLIETRTRLDAKLWALLATARGLDSGALQRRAILRNVTRHALLMTA